MKKIILFIVFLFITDLYSQKTTKIDSLENVIKIKTATFETYNLLAWEYIQVNPETTISYNNLSKKYIKSNKHKGQYLVLSAGIKSMQGDLVGSEKEANEGIKLSLIENDFSTISSGYNVLARVYLMQGDFEKTELFSSKAYHYVLKTNNLKKILSSIINYGSALSQNEKIDKGIEIYKTAEKYFYDGSEYQKGHLYFNLGRLFFNKGDIKNALIYLKKSEEQFSKIDNNISDIFQVYSTYGEVYTQLKDEKKAMFYLEKAKTHSRNEIDNSDLYFIKAQLFLNLNKLDSALKNIKEAIKLNEESQNYSRLGEDYLLYSDILKSQKQYSSAEIYLEKAIKFFKENDESENLRITYERIITNFFLKNNLTAFSSNFDSYLQLNKDFVDKEKIKSLYDLNEKYKTAEKEAKIKTQQLQLEKEKTNKYIALGGIGLLVLLSAGGFVFYRNKQKQKEKELQFELDNLNNDINEMELQNLNQQLDPHEITNFIDSISDKVLRQDAKMHEQLMLLWDVTNIVLNHKDITTDIDTEIKNLEKYFMYQQEITYPTFDYNISNLILNSDYKIPRLLLRNLAKNSIKHGIKGISEKGKIDVLIHEDTKSVILQVEDNGKGLTDENIKKGIGTSTYENIFTKLNIKNKEKATIEIINKDKGVVVKVKIPKNYRFEN